jgi:NADH-quinone oxidoreductase subunit J
VSVLGIESRVFKSHHSENQSLKFNSNMLLLNTFLSSLLIFSGSFIFISGNPVHSVLFLILTFCNASAVLFLFTAEFLALVIIIIYVGAIAVLFLFIVMICGIFFLQISLTVDKFFFCFNPPFEATIFAFDPFSNPVSFRFKNSFDSLNNIDVLGQALYNYFLPCFLIIGFVLLVAMIGAIVLTLNFNSLRKNELVSRQLSRSLDFLSQNR